MSECSVPTGSSHVESAVRLGLVFLIIVEAKARWLTVCKLGASGLLSVNWGPVYESHLIPWFVPPFRPSSKPGMSSQILISHLLRF